MRRVHTGFEWNKYNQTHYDMDNPPPKIVQGYKFNIFYPDLIDKNSTPEYHIVSIAKSCVFPLQEVKLIFNFSPNYRHRVQTTQILGYYVSTPALRTKISLSKWWIASGSIRTKRASGVNFKIIYSSCGFILNAIVIEDDTEYYAILYCGSASCRLSPIAVFYDLRWCEYVNINYTVLQSR